MATEEKRALISASAKIKFRACVYSQKKMMKIAMKSLVYTIITSMRSIKGRDLK